MKRTLTPAISLGLTAVLGAALQFATLAPAYGDETSPAQKSKSLKTFSGTVAQVNERDKVLIAESFWSTKSFSLGDTCQVSLEDKPAATLADLTPGQRVQIEYDTVDGVKIAQTIAQRNLVHHGRLTFIDRDQKKVGVEHGMVTRNYTLTDDVKVVLNDDQPGTLADLKVGQLVDVIYESRSHSGYQARRIEQKNPTFTGTIRSLDAATRTVRAKNFFAEKQFRLGDDCRIVLPDNPDAALRDLRIGDRVEFVYEDQAGVWIANRIGPESSAAAAVGSETAKANPKFP